MKKLVAIGDPVKIIDIYNLFNQNMNNLIRHLNNVYVGKIIKIVNELLWDDLTIVPLKFITKYKELYVEYVEIYTSSGHLYIEREIKYEPIFMDDKFILMEEKTIIRKFNPLDPYGEELWENKKYTEVYELKLVEASDEIPVIDIVKNVLPRWSWVTGNEELILKYFNDNYKNKIIKIKISLYQRKYYHSSPGEDGYITIIPYAFYNCNKREINLMCDFYYPNNKIPKTYSPSELISINICGDSITIMEEKKLISKKPINPLDPYGEELWENKYNKEIDPFDEEEWEDYDFLNKRIIFKMNSSYYISHLKNRHEIYYFMSKKNLKSMKIYPLSKRDIYRIKENKIRLKIYPFFNKYYKVIYYNNISDKSKIIFLDNDYYNKYLK